MADNRLNRKSANCFRSFHLNFKKGHLNTIGFAGNLVN